MIWHNSTPDEVVKELCSDADEGLSSAEAEKRLSEHGKNLFVCEEEMSLADAVIKHLKTVPAILLFSLLIIFILRELVTGRRFFAFPIIIFVILLIKESICVFLEYRSRNSLALLKNSIKTSARVIRGGEEITVDSEQLVPGDIILLTGGDYIPADARIIESSTLRCDESTLRGEKEVIVVQKDGTSLHEDFVPVTERSNMLYCGCHVISGNVKAIVTETGENAEMRRFVKRDKIFYTKGIEDRISDRFDGFYKVFKISALLACLIITVLGTFAVRGSVGWGKFLEALICAVCFYIAVVPGSFPTRIACLLVLGIKRIEKDHTVIFEPATVEKLSSVTTVCVDKTGTLTQNRMTLRKVFDGEQMVDLNCDRITKQADIAMRFCTLCCDGNSTDHTEVAIMSAASRFLGISKYDFDSEFPRMACIPLTPERKIKTTVNMIDGKAFAIVRGAPDIIVNRCTGADPDALLKISSEMASDGMRVLAISYKVYDDVPSDTSSDNLEFGMHFLGFLGFIDRERDGIVRDIETCRKAGISTVMFTGDHINSAESVARKMKILRGGEIAVTGIKLDELSNEDLAESVKNIRVYAGISSEQRVRIVNALHENGENVLITADSPANYAPMAVADIGCAMGKTGTDVAKGNADAVIYDDSFATIVKAIRNARGIFGNFTKYVNYYVSMCVCLFISFITDMIVLRQAVPDTRLILFGAIFALLFPIASIGFETADPSIMRAAPRTIGQQLFDLKSLLTAAICGVLISIPQFVVLMLNGRSSSGGSAAFISIIFSLILYMFSTRSTELFYKRILHNRFLLAVSAISILFTLIIALTPAGKIFGMVPTDLFGLATAVIVPLIIPLIFEAKKLPSLINK